MPDEAAVRSRRRCLKLRCRTRVAATLLLALAWPASSISSVDSRPASSSAAAPFAASRSVCRDVLPRSDHTSVCRASEHDPVRLAQYMSNICYTPYGWCYLPQFGPIGAPCWCPSPYGPVGGYVR